MGSDLPLIPTYERWSKTADVYALARPVLPKTVIELLIGFSGNRDLTTVVDLGCGTGGSTRGWCPYAKQVVGIDPNQDMLTQARFAKSLPANIVFINTAAENTTLDNNCADIVTAVQSFHWMDPVLTLNEIYRILKPGGIFAAIDNLWPVISNWGVEAAEVDVCNRAVDIEKEQGLESRDSRLWPNSGHFSRISESGLFRYVREITAHNTEMGNVERLINLLRTRGKVGALLKAGITEADLGLDVFAAKARAVFGDQSFPITFSYLIRAAVK